MASYSPNAYAITAYSQTAYDILPVSASFTVDDTGALISTDDKVLLGTILSLDGGILVLSGEEVQVVGTGTSTDSGAIAGADSSETAVALNALTDSGAIGATEAGTITLGINVTPEDVGLLGGTDSSSVVMTDVVTFRAILVLDEGEIRGSSGLNDRWIPDSATTGSWVPDDLET